MRNNIDSLSSIIVNSQYHLTYLKFKIWMPETLLLIATVSKIQTAEDGTKPSSWKIYRQER